MRTVGIIPARMASTRYPGKPLAKILGIPMVGHVYFRSAMNRNMAGVYVATCDREIADYIVSVGGKAVMTSPSHQRASDRAAEAMLKIEKEEARKVDIAVMIQGDEPMLHPEMIDEALGPLLADESIDISNLMFPVKDREEFNDPNCVKVVCDTKGFALYFSREPIPSEKKAGRDTISGYKQVAIIPFRRDHLIAFNRLRETPLEKIESVDMLRLLEHGYRVKMIETRHATYSVDTPADLKGVERRMENDPLSRIYAQKAVRGGVV